METCRRRVEVDSDLTTLENMFTNTNAHLKLFLRLWHEFQLLPRLELELGDGGRTEETEDNL